MLLYFGCATHEKLARDFDASDTCHGCADLQIQTNPHISCLITSATAANKLDVKSINHNEKQKKLFETASVYLWSFNFFFSWLSFEKYCKNLQFLMKFLRLERARADCDLLHPATAGDSLEVLDRRRRAT